MRPLSMWPHAVSKSCCRRLVAPLCGQVPPATGTEQGAPLCCEAQVLQAALNCFFFFRGAVEPQNNRKPGTHPRAGVLHSDAQGAASQLQVFRNHKKRQTTTEQPLTSAQGYFTATLKVLQASCKCFETTPHPQTTTEQPQTSAQGYFTATLKVLQAICKCCGCILLTEQQRAAALKALGKRRRERGAGKAMLKHILAECKKAKQCPHCLAPNGVVKKMAASFKLLHDPYAKRVRCCCRD